MTYGFGANKGLAPIESGGTHLKPIDWHNKAAEDNTVLIDVRNANENAIGRFQPLNDASRVLDPYMRVSTEFPQWVDDNMDKLKKAKNIMMSVADIAHRRGSRSVAFVLLPPSLVLTLVPLSLRLFVSSFCLCLCSLLCVLGTVPVVFVVSVRLPCWFRKVFQLIRCFN